VAAIAVHPKGLAVAIDEGGEPELGGVVVPEEQAGVVEADAVDRGEILGLPGGGIE
jgi:hypothetical protein